MVERNGSRPELTERQLGVLHAFAQGLNGHETAESLGVCRLTVVREFGAIKDTFGVPRSKTGREAARKIVKSAVRKRIIAKEAVSAALVEGLIPQEEVLVEHLIQGKNWVEIANECVKSPSSISHEISQLNAKFRIDGKLPNSRLLLIFKLQERGITQLPEIFIEESVREGRYINQTYQGLILLSEGYSKQEVEQELNLPVKHLASRLYKLRCSLGIEFCEGWEEEAIESAQALGQLPQTREIQLPSLVTGRKLTALEIAALHTLYTRAAETTASTIEYMAEHNKVRPATIDAILRKACHRLGINWREKYAYLTVAERLYAERFKTRILCEKVAIKCGFLNGRQGVVYQA